MKHSHRHGGDEDREVEAERADQKEHEQHGFQVGTLPDISKPFHQAAPRSMGSLRTMKFIDPQQAQRAKHRDKRGRVDQEHPA